MVEILLDILTIIIGVTGGIILYGLLREGRRNLAKWIFQKRGDFKKFFRSRRRTKEKIRLEKAREAFKKI